MNSTHSSLLIRIRDITDSKAWSDFHSLYSELIFRYALARGVNKCDADDIRSACFEAVVRQIKKFEYMRDRGGFKSWLRTIVNRRVIDLQRKRYPISLESGALELIPGKDLNSSELWETEWKKQHLRYCVERASREVPDKTAESFRLLVEDGCSVEEISEQLGLTINQVYKAKSRMLSKIRQIMRKEFPDDFETS